MQTTLTCRSLLTILLICCEIYAVYIDLDSPCSSRNFNSLYNVKLLSTAANESTIF